VTLIAALVTPEPSRQNQEKGLSMSRLFRRGTVAALGTGIISVAAMAAFQLPAGAASHVTSGDEFLQTNLISNVPQFGAQLVDPGLQNPWGLAASPASPLWVSGNNSGLAGVYSISPGGTSVTKAGLTVTVPGGRVSTSDGSSPTGQVFNGSSGFVVTTKAGSGPAAFIFDSESGQITAWNPTADPITAGASTATLEDSSPTAVYKGLAIAATDQGTFLYAANFDAGTVDVFNSTFQPVNLLGNFSDPGLPSGYAPFGIQEINGLLYVTYARQDAAKHDDVPGLGRGFVDIFTTNGLLIRRLATRGVLDAPWGLAQAPSGFGAFGGDLLVGNFGNGRINAFDPITGRFAGEVRTDQHQPLTISGLWGLRFGTATDGGPGTLLFSAGPDNQADGLLGSINPVAHG
jgi:uncharacterized protein (TIGR03118 family)